MTDSPAEAYFRENYLWPGEVITWSGQPGYLRSMAFNWWFCIVGCFMSALLFMFWWASSSPFEDIRLPEALITLFSLWLTLTPVRNIWRAHRTVYFVTDHRAVILEKGLRIKETVFFPGDITDFRLIRRRGDRGDIWLRLSKQRIKTAYQEDKEKWVPGLSRDVGAWAGSAPFLSFTDGFWGVEKVSIAANALKDLTLTAGIKR
jgi:hypothetical protein